MSEKQIKIWTWLARILTLLGLLAGVIAAADYLPIVVQRYAALAVALLGAGIGWIRGFLPSQPNKEKPSEGEPKPNE